MDQLETALACSEERIKELEDRLAATEKVEAYNHGGPPAQFASAQRVEELEKALAHFEERRKTAEAWNKTDDGIFALFAGAFLLLLKLADRLRSQNEDSTFD